MKKASKKNSSLSRAVKEENSFSIGTLRGARTTGGLRSITIDGEKGLEGVFVGFTAINSAAGAITNFTFTSIVAALSGGLFAKLYSVAGSGEYANARITEIGITCAPCVATLANRSCSGAYALSPPSAAAVPGNMLDVLALQESMMYVAPLRETTTYSVSALPFCTRPSRTLVYRPGGVDKPWIGASGGIIAYPTVPVVSLVYYGFSTATETSYVYISARVQFKTLNPGVA